ncbi:MAG: protein-disulfide reductase DsbD N-terminal domain-containing protein, partial [Gammaproteobacteria bacterium]|nr:protein-disulfide reductase DsbD N-terminal domain-containing protein [Gammaproteobacteria bacterium]
MNLTGITNRVLLHVTALAALLMPALVSAIEFDEVKSYDEVFRISAQALDRDSVEIRWQIAPDYYLYNNKFLGFSTTTAGVTLGEAIIPPGEKKFDELLGEEVIKYHGNLVITLPLDSVPASVSRVDLEIRSQGCLESVLCYPPSSQDVSVELPASGLTAEGSLASAFDPEVAPQSNALLAEDDE